MKTKPPFLTTVIAGLLSVLSSKASATLVSLDGDGFTAIYDDQALGLFGVPTLSGDGKTILFSPFNFLATSSGTQGVIQARDNAQFELILDNGKQLSGLSLIENGDYRQVNQDDLNNAPAVDVAGELRLTNLFTGNQFQAVNFSAGSLTATCATLSGCPITPWTATATVNAPLSWGEVDIRVRLQNVLTAESYEAWDLAEIEKKHSSQTISLTPTFVPVPGAIWLFGSVLVGLMGLRRKN